MLESFKSEFCILYWYMMSIYLFLYLYCITSIRIYKFNTVHCTVYEYDTIQQQE